MLPATLPCAVRTFLQCALSALAPAAVWRASPRALSPAPSMLARDGRTARECVSFFDPETAHESREHSRDHRPTRRTSASTACSASSAGVDQVRTQQPGRLDQGPDRAVHGRGRRAQRRAQARRHHHRADLGQHRHRPGHGGRRQGLPADPGDARQHVGRAAPPDAGLRREVRPHAARERHEGLHRPRPGTGGADARRLDAPAVREPGQRRGACAHHGEGNPGGLPGRPGRR